MAIPKELIIQKLQDSELFFADAIIKNIDNAEIGLIIDNKEKLNRIYFLITALKLQVAKLAYLDTITQNLYIKLKLEIPFSLVNTVLDPDYTKLGDYIVIEGGSSIDDSNLVHKTGGETIVGIKTFTLSPIVPDAVETNQAVNYGQLLDFVESIGDLFPPTYVQPVETLTSTQSTSGLEYGQIIDIPLTSVFTQNDAGTSVAITILKDIDTLATSSTYTDNDVSMTLTPIIYQSTRSYDEGIVKDDVFGNPHPNGHILAGSVNSNLLSYRGYYYLPYGAGNIPTNSVEARALPQNRLSNTGNTFILNSGTIYIKQIVCVPPSMSITNVIDLDASNQNLTTQYILLDSNFTINNIAGTPVSGYKLYVRTQGSPYLSNHRHQITIS